MNLTTVIAHLARADRHLLMALLATAVLAFASLAAATPAMAAADGKPQPKSDGDLTPRDRLAAGSTTQRRPVPAKPAHAKVTGGQSRTQLHVKLREGLHGRVRGASLTSVKDGENLDAVVEIIRRHRARITPLFDAPENVLASEKHTLEGTSGTQLADLNLYFRVTLPKGAPTEQVIDQLNASDLVEIAYAEPTPVTPALASDPAPPSTTPDFSSRQSYRNAAPTGIDADHGWTVAGGRGNGVKVVDIEYSWNQTHEDLAAINGKLIPNGTPVASYSDDHGTAVMGELFGTDNGFGVTGIVPDATAGMVNASNTGGYNLANAIWVAQANTAPGDVILLEQQIAGPNWDDTDQQEEYAPVEWYQAYYDAIARATAAGNGYQNLDGAEYLRAFDRSYRDSGAILVGAGGGPCAAWGQPARGRLPFSNYGGRVDVQAWGECVGTAGYGDLQSGDRNSWYTARFGGTSSASPIVTGAAAILSSIAEQRGLAPLTSVQMRSLLRVGATAQTTTGALSGAIGPLPNLRAAIPALGGGGTTGCTDDVLEANDTMATATPLDFGATVAAQVCPGNIDLFAVDLATGERVIADTSFTHAQGDLDISLHDSTGARVTVAESTTDNEHLEAAAAQTGRYYLMVYGYQNATNTYDLTATKLPAELPAVATLRAQAGLGRVTLSWTYPSTGAVSGVDVRVAQGSTAPSPFAGTSVYRGSGSRTVATGLAPGRTYTFAVYTTDDNGNTGPARVVTVHGSVLRRSAPSAVQRGTAARIVGTLTNAAGRPLTGRNVVLFERAAGGSRWNRVTTKPTNADGVVAFRRIPTAAMSYRLQFAGSGLHMGVTATVTVRVR